MSTPLDACVSVFHGSTDTTPIENVPLATVLERIQNGTYQQYVEWLRDLHSSGDSAGYRRAKEQSTAFTPCCALQTRAKETPWTQKLISTTGLTYYDFDHVDDPETLKGLLAQCPALVFAFLSPGGQGLKVALAATGIVDTSSYKLAWRHVLGQLRATYPGVTISEDKHVKFLHALCYMSWDPHVYIQPAPVPLVVPPATPKRQLMRHTNTGAPDYDLVASAVLAIPNFDTEYETWLQLGMGLHSTGAAWARSLWDDWSRQSGKYDEGKQEKSWSSFTSDGAVQLGTVFHMAQQHGWRHPRAGLHGEHRNGTRHVPDMTGSTPAQNQGQGQQEPDPLDAAWQAAETLLHTLPGLAEDAQKEDAVLDALPTLAPLDTIAWMRLKRQLKTAVSSLNLNDLERARSELRRTVAQGAGHTIGNAQAQIASQLASDYAGTLAYDLRRQAWMTYGHGLWTPIEVERVGQRITAYMDEALHGDYTWHDLSGVEHLLRTRLAHQVTRTTPGWLPFQKGALCLQTMTLHPHSPDLPFTWQLPHAYDSQATCPQTIAWLHETVGHAHDQVQVLRAYAKAVVTGRVDLQRYLEVIGPGGTGKGTYTRLLQALVGSENTLVTELKHLETNRFELSNLHGKVLMLITDAERYGGPVNQLKAITGQDFVRMEEKFKAQRTEIAPVMVLIAANEPIQSADYTSGLVRRRLSMYFRRRPTTPRDLLTWKDGAWQGDLAPEIPGVLNWILALPDTAMEILLQQTTNVVPSLQHAWAYSLVDTNPLADWSNQALLLDAHTDTQGRVPAVNVGKAVPLDRTHGYEHEDSWLYPNYRAWVDATGGKPLSSRRFTGLLKDLFEHQLRLDGVEHTDDMYGSRFHGIRLRTYSDKDKPLFITRDPTPMTDMTPPMTSEPRVHDGYDGCDRFLQTLYRHLPTFPADNSPSPRGVGVSIGDFSNNPSLVSDPSFPRGSSVIETSHPSLVRGNGFHTTPSPEGEPLPEVAKASPRPIAVQDWCYLLSADGIQQNAEPYLCKAIAQGPDGQWYAQFLEIAVGWLVERCEKAPDSPREADGAEFDEGVLL